MAKVNRTEVAGSIDNNSEEVKNSNGGEDTDLSTSFLDSLKGNLYIVYY